jgi:hypothetical protein
VLRSSRSSRNARPLSGMPINADPILISLRMM